VSIYGLFADPGTIGGHLALVAGVLPGGAIGIIRDQLTRLTFQGRATLGISFVLSLAVSLWSANGGIKALFGALNVVYKERKERSFVKLNLTSLVFTIGIICLLLIVLASVVVVPEGPPSMRISAASILRSAVLMPPTRGAAIFSFAPCCFTARRLRRPSQGSSRGLSRWLFIGQISASTGFVSYSWLLKNWVFVATNILMIGTALLGEVIYLHNKRQQH
jgi:uncharacterized BrkB/YihY/UPF0761 family membrane protein